MLHTFTLVHDDIMDNADIRRGEPTLHKKYDLSTAILAGDVLLAIAYEYLLKDAKLNPAKVTAQFTHGLIEVCEGQALDKEFESRKSVTIDEYLVMITKKTAVLVETCCAIGALLADADSKVLKGLKQFGLNLGIAFQIQDDLLDVVGNTKEFGKKIGGDLIEGKKTYPFLIALQNAKGKNLSALKKVIAQKGIPEADVPLYRKIYEEVGAIEASGKAIAGYTRKAVKSLNVLPASEDREILLWLSDLLIKRTY
jgi:geranylgeranyl diphosphate synthase type II